MNERTFHHSGAHKLDDPERSRWLPTDDLFARLEVRPGTDVVDVGVGTGYFAIPLVDVVKPGRVFAVDLQPEMLARLEEKLASLPELPENLLPVQGDATSTGLPEGCADRVLMANLWHELDDQPAALREAARLLRPGGCLAILDWSPAAQPPPGPPADHRVPVESAVRTLEENGWRILSSDRFNSYHYLVLATPGN